MELVLFISKRFLIILIILLVIPLFSHIPPSLFLGTFSKDFSRSMKLIKPFFYCIIDYLLKCEDVISYDSLLIDTHYITKWFGYQLKNWQKLKSFPDNPVEGM